MEPEVKPDTRPEIRQNAVANRVSRGASQCDVSETQHRPDRPKIASLTEALIRQNPRFPWAWQVQLPGEAHEQIVDRLQLSQGESIVLCTCCENDNPTCGHARAVEKQVLRKRAIASVRRAEGLSYSGLWVETHPRLTSDNPLTEAQVFVRQGEQVQPLEPKDSQAVRNHSPDGFSWGYSGSGPAQLALAILLDYTEDVQQALQHYQEFKSHVIAALPQEVGRWEIGGPQIQQFLYRHLQEMTFPYTGFYNSESLCRIRWTARRDKVIVVATELPDNPGASITNRAEHLALQVCRHLEIEPEQLVWVEHYPDQRPAGSRFHNPVLEEHFNLVAFHWDGKAFTRPQWMRVKKEFVEALIGQSLPPETVQETPPEP